MSKPTALAVSTPRPPTRTSVLAFGGFWIATPSTLASMS